VKKVCQWEGHFCQMLVLSHLHRIFKLQRPRQFVHARRVAKGEVCLDTDPLYSTSSHYRVWIKMQNFCLTGYGDNQGGVEFITLESLSSDLYFDNKPACTVWTKWIHQT